MNPNNNIYKKLKRWFVIRSAFYEAKKHLLSLSDTTKEEKGFLKKVKLQVHEADTMYTGNAVRYLSVGLSASRCIREALQNVDKDYKPNVILDFPSGYGRVLRYLCAMYPQSKVIAAEIDKNFLEFCKNTFGVDTLISKSNFRELSSSVRFDLIWCGSLFTHIDKQLSRDLLQFFYNHLSENGICIFTTHGKLVIERLKSKSYTYNLTSEKQDTILQELSSTGYGYTDYSHRKGYGISVVSNEYITNLANEIGKWKQIMFLEHGWDNHQDVFAFQKIS